MKLVFESLNELSTFKKYNDPLKSLNIGLNENLNFERRHDKMSSLGVGQKQLIISWLNKMGVENYIINNDFTIDVYGNVDLDYRDLIEFPNYIQFNMIDGYFDCSQNRLINLRGCPKIVIKGFGCTDNQLTSLKGCPTSVIENFYCRDNKKQFTKDEVRKLCKVQGDIYTT